MPILTNFEVKEFRSMTAFAGQLFDLLEDLQGECEQGFEDPALMAQKRFDIAKSLGISLPLNTTE